MSNYTVPKDVVFRQLGEETVLVHLGTSEIFRLNETGARIWELLSAGEALAAIEQTMADEFEVSSEELRDQIEALLSSLIEAGLLLDQKHG